MKVVIYLLNDRGDQRVTLRADNKLLSTIFVPDFDFDLLGKKPFDLWCPKFHEIIRFNELFLAIFLLQVDFKIFASSSNLLALRRFMRQWHLPTFVVGSQSAAAALDLARVGMIRLQREYGIGGVELLTVVQP